MISSSRPLIENSNVPPRSSVDRLVERAGSAGSAPCCRAPRSRLAHRRQDADQHDAACRARRAAARALSTSSSSCCSHAARGRRRRSSCGSQLASSWNRPSSVVKCGSPSALEHLRARRGPGASVCVDRGTSPARRRCGARRSRTGPRASMRSSARRSARMRAHELAPALLAVELAVDFLCARVVRPSVAASGPLVEILAAASARHVGQSWCHSGPHESTRFGTPLRPSTFAIAPRLADVLGAALARRRAG